jgi:FkbM family methyltransferase
LHSRPLADVATAAPPLREPPQQTAFFRDPAPDNLQQRRQQQQVQQVQQQHFTHDRSNLLHLAQEVVWSDAQACAEEATREECCLRMAAARARPGDKPWRIVDARAGTARYRMAVYGDGVGDMVSNVISSHGSWEDKETTEFLKVVTAAPHLPFMDIGGNIGWFTFAMAMNGISVFTFEPFRQNVNLQRTTACLNPAAAARIRLFNAALGDQDANCFQVATNGNFGNGIVICRGPGEPENIPPGDVKLDDMIVRRLDDVARLIIQPRFPISALKMDTEGYELAVLRGGRAFFSSPQSPRQFYTEVNPGMMERQKVDPVDFLRFILETLRYRCPDAPDLNNKTDIHEFFTTGVGRGYDNLHCFAPK